MTRVQVPARKTPITPVEALTYLWRAHADVIGGPCPTALLCVLGAHSALETASWGAMWCNNFGNISGVSELGEWCSIHGADEVMPDGSVRVRVDGAAADGFAAWRSPIEGARAYVRHLGVATKPPAPNRYVFAWHAAEKGDVGEFCAQLRAHGYFTAGLARYTAGVRAAHDRIRDHVLPDFLATVRVAGAAP